MDNQKSDWFVHRGVIWDVDRAVIAAVAWDWDVNWVDFRVNWLNLIGDFGHPALKDFLREVSAEAR